MKMRVTSMIGHGKGQVIGRGCHHMAPPQRIANIDLDRTA